MPCIQTKISPNNQAMLEVLIFPGGKWTPSTEATNDLNQLPPKSFVRCHALIDTGANQSCISKLASEYIGLTPTETASVQGVHGSQETKIYSVDLVLPDILWFQENISLCEVNYPKENPFQAIIGMDIISLGTLHFNYRSALSPEGICTFCI